MSDGVGVSFLSRAGTALADFVLPPVCLSCREPVAGHGALCPACWPQIDFITPPICDRLGIPLPFDTGEGAISAAAAANPPTYGRARAVAAYSGEMRALIHDLKYHDRQDGVALYGRWMARAGGELLSEADLLVPVPLYWLRLWSRRFNQAAQLAQAVCELRGVPLDTLLLKRVRRTKTQVGMSVSQRRRNVAGAFKVADGKAGVLDGANVVLVDDVITTGATVEACAKALLSAGAARVDVLALARVTDPLAATI